MLVMKKNGINILEHIKKYVEYYFAVISALTIIWGGFELYDGWTHDNKELHVNVKSIIETQKKQAEMDSILIINQSEMQNKLNEIQKITDENSENLKLLQTSYIKYISKDKALSKEDFLKYMQGLTLDLKRNSFINKNSERNFTTSASASLNE